MSDPVRQLKTYGRNVAETHMERLPRVFGKLCFICVNSYRSFRQNIGIAPITDAVAFAKCAKYFEYEIFFVHEPHAQTFMQFLEFFLANTLRHLVVYYVGQGMTPHDLNRTRARTYDEVFTFDDAAIADEQFLDALIGFKNPQNRVTLITDTCKPATAWNLPGSEVKGRVLPPGIVTISTSATTATSKHMMALVLHQGVFTFHLTKEIKANPKITASELEAKMTSVIAEFSQVFSVRATAPEDLDLPVLETDFET
jgi:hypothetical protein